MALTNITQWIVDTAAGEPDLVHAVSVPALQAFGIVSGGVMLARAALAAQEALHVPGANANFLDNKILQARFYADHIMPQAQAHARTVLKGARPVAAAATLIWLGGDGTRTSAQVDRRGQAADL